MGLYCSKKGIKDEVVATESNRELGLWPIFGIFRYFSLCVISFRIQKIPFRFKAKQAKLTFYFAISLRSFSLLFLASFRFEAKFGDTLLGTYWFSDSVLSLFYYFKPSGTVRIRAAFLNADRANPDPKQCLTYCCSTRQVKSWQLVLILGSPEL